MKRNVWFAKQMYYLRPDKQDVTVYVFSMFAGYHNCVLQVRNFESLFVVLWVSYINQFS